MKPCKRFSHLLLWMISLTLQPCFWAQKLEMSSQVTGYVGHNVTLPCSFIKGTQYSNVTQSQWEFQSPEGNKTLIMVFSKQHGESVHDSHLKGRVDMDDQSLQIKNVELSDAGTYICTIVTFPLGLFHNITTLNVQVQELKPVSFWFIRGISFGFLLLLITLPVATYFFPRRCDCTNRSSIHR